MNIGIFEISSLITDVKKCVEFMRGHNLLIQDYFCCHQIASKVHDISLTDREIFQCKVCKKRKSIRYRSFWAKSKLSLPVLLALLYFFCEDLSINEACKMLKSRISRRVCIQWYNYFRDITTTYFVQNPVRFVNCEVHWNETFIGG